jgi:hypothetical protein
VTFFRCTADQLVGHPSDSLEGRTGFGRRTWATKAHDFYFFTANPPDTGSGVRFWLPSLFDPDVANAIEANIDLYPVYINNNTPNQDLFVGPGPNNATYFGTTFTQISNLSFTGAFNLPIGVKVDALCEAGCYSPEQEVRFGDSNVPVAQAQASGQRSVTTLTPNATLDSLEFMQNSIGRWMVDIAAANQTIITLRMKSGGELRVTTEHPLVTSEGVMKRAEDLVVGESLVRDNGASDPVVSMSSTTEFTKVYNLQPTTTDLTSNILVAQGYLSGSVRYQNEYIKYLNRVLLRHNIPSSVIARSTPMNARAATH